MIEPEITIDGRRVKAERITAEESRRATVDMTARQAAEWFGRLTLGQQLAAIVAGTIVSHGVHHLLTTERTS